MSDILEYFDSISIDVAKRKYYNANKVNAVLAELREQAENLVEENERLRDEISALKDRDRVSAETLSGMQSVYRETLGKAHERADSLVREAEEYSARIQRESEYRAEQTAKQVEDCINTVRMREEQNIEFLNARLQSFLAELCKPDNPNEKEVSSVSSADRTERKHTEVPPELHSEEQRESIPEEDADAQTPAELQNKVGQIAEEIRALENESETAR